MPTAYVSMASELKRKIHISTEMYYVTWELFRREGVLITEKNTLIKNTPNIRKLPGKFNYVVKDSNNFQNA